MYIYIIYLYISVLAPRHSGPYCTASGEYTQQEHAQKSTWYVYEHAHMYASCSSGSRNCSIVALIYICVLTCESDWRHCSILAPTINGSYTNIYMHACIWKVRGIAWGANDRLRCCGAYIYICMHIYERCLKNCRNVVPTIKLRCLLRWNIYACIHMRGVWGMTV